VAFAVLLVLAGSPPRPARAAPTAEPGARREATLVDSATLESSFGIRITQIAVTGGGGLVDLRFTVLDPAKARPLLADHASPPRLVPEGGGNALQAPAHGAMRNVRLHKDAACFLIYPNARSAIQPGTRVAVAFGDVRVEPVVAK
jgi:hypothetical protein